MCGCTQASCGELRGGLAVTAGQGREAWGAVRWFWAGHAGPGWCCLGVLCTGIVWVVSALSSCHTCRQNGVGCDWTTCGHATAAPAPNHSLRPPPNPSQSSRRHRRLAPGPHLVPHPHGPGQHEKVKAGGATDDDAADQGQGARQARRRRAACRLQLGPQVERGWAGLKRKGLRGQRVGGREFGRGPFLAVAPEPAQAHTHYPPHQPWV